MYNADEEYMGKKGTESVFSYGIEYVVFWGR